MSKANALPSLQEPRPDVQHTLTCPKDTAMLTIHASDTVVEFVGSPSATWESASDALATQSASIPTSITHVRLIGVRCVQQAALQQLLERCTQLKSLELPAAEQPTSEPLCPAEHDSTQLVAQRLSRPAGAWTLQQLPVSLTHLCLSDCGSLHPTSLMHLRGLTALKRLCIRGLRVPPSNSPSELPFNDFEAATALPKATAVAAVGSSSLSNRSPSDDSMAAGIQGGNADDSASKRSPETLVGTCGSGGGGGAAAASAGRRAELACCSVVSSLQHWSRLTSLEDLELVGQAGNKAGNPWDALLSAFLPSLPHLTRLAFHPPVLKNAAVALASLAQATSLVRLELGGCSTAPLRLNESAWRALAAVPTLEQLLLGHCEAAIGSALAASFESPNNGVRMAYRSAATGLGLAAAASLNNWAAGGKGSSGGSLFDGGGFGWGSGRWITDGSSGRWGLDSSGAGGGYGQDQCGGSTTPVDSPGGAGASSALGCLKTSRSGGAADSWLDVGLSGLQPIHEWSWDRECAAAAALQASPIVTQGWGYAGGAVTGGASHDSGFGGDDWQAHVCLAGDAAVEFSPDSPWGNPEHRRTGARDSSERLAAEIAAARKPVVSGFGDGPDRGQYPTELHEIAASPKRDGGGCMVDGEGQETRVGQFMVTVDAAPCCMRHYKQDALTERGVEVLSVASVDLLSEDTGEAEPRVFTALPMSQPIYVGAAGVVSPAAATRAVDQSGALHMTDDLPAPLPAIGEDMARPHTASTGIATPSDRTSMAVSAEASCTGSSSIPSSRSSYCINMTRSGVAPSSSARRVSEGGYSWCSSCANDGSVVAAAAAAAAAVAVAAASRDAEGAMQASMSEQERSYARNEAATEHCSKAVVAPGIVTADESTLIFQEGQKAVVDDNDEDNHDADAAASDVMQIAGGRAVVHMPSANGHGATVAAEFTERLGSGVMIPDVGEGSSALPEEAPSLPTAQLSLGGTSGACGSGKMEKVENSGKATDARASEADIVAAALTAAAAFRATALLEAGSTQGSSPELVSGSCFKPAGLETQQLMAAAVTAAWNAAAAVASVASEPVRAGAAIADDPISAPPSPTTSSAAAFHVGVDAHERSALLPAAAAPPPAVAYAAALATAVTLAAAGSSISSTAAMKRVGSAGADLAVHSSHSSGPCSGFLPPMRRVQQRGGAGSPFLSLQRLSLLRIDDEDMVLLANCVALQGGLLSLSLADCGSLQEGGMKSVPKLRRLEHLSLRGLTATYDPIIGGWTTLTELRTLEIGLAPAAAAAMAAAAGEVPYDVPPTLMPPSAMPAVIASTRDGADMMDPLSGRSNALPCSIGRQGHVGDGGDMGAYSMKRDISSVRSSQTSGQTLEELNPRGLFDSGRCGGSGGVDSANSGTWGRWPSPVTEVTLLQAALDGAACRDGTAAAVCGGISGGGSQQLRNVYDGNLDGAEVMVAGGDSINSDGDDTGAGGSTYAEAMYGSVSSRRSSDMGAVCADYLNHEFFGKDDYSGCGPDSVDFDDADGGQTICPEEEEEEEAEEDFFPGVDGDGSGADAALTAGVDAIWTPAAHHGESDLSASCSTGTGQRRPRDFIPVFSEFPVGLCCGRGRGDACAGMGLRSSGQATSAAAAPVDDEVVGADSGRQGSSRSTPLGCGAGGFSSVTSAARAGWDVGLGSGTAVRWANPLAVQVEEGSGDGDGDERVHGARGGVAAVAAARISSSGIAREEAAPACVLTDNGLQLLLQLLPKLEELYLHNLPHLTPATLEQVLSRPGLRALVVDGCRQLTPDFCELLSVSALDLTASMEAEGDDGTSGGQGSGLRLLLIPA